jgi:hypothetical protein
MSDHHLELASALWNTLGSRKESIEPIVVAVDLVPPPVIENVARLIGEMFRYRPTRGQVAAMAEIAWSVTMELDALTVSRRRPANPKRRRSML